MFPELFNSERAIEELEMYDAANFADHQPTDHQASPPSNLFENMEQAFWSVNHKFATTW